MKGYLSVPNWDKLQHYKDRNPPWIKLHNELLENYEFECLQDASKAHLILIWLLASRTNNKMNPDPRWISRKIGASSDVDVQALIEAGFLQLNREVQSVERDASKMLQTVEQSACLEGEGEGEERERRERIKTPMSASEKNRHEPFVSDSTNREQNVNEALPKEKNSELFELEENQPETTPKKKPSKTQIQVDEIFLHWCRVMDKSPNKTKLTKEREKAIRARLKDGYSVDEIKRAIEGCRADSWSMGSNDRHKPFNDIELICRTGKKLEGFRDALTSSQQKQDNQRSVAEAMRDIGDTNW